MAKRSRAHQNRKAVLPSANTPSTTQQPTLPPSVDCPSSWTAQFCRKMRDATPDEDILMLKVWDGRRRTLVMYEEIVRKGGNQVPRHPYVALRVTIDGKPIESPLELTRSEKLSFLGVET